MWGPVLGGRHQFRDPFWGAAINNRTQFLILGPFFKSLSFMCISEAPLCAILSTALVWVLVSLLGTILQSFGYQPSVWVIRLQFGSFGHQQRVFGHK